MVTLNVGAGVRVTVGATVVEGRIGAGVGVGCLVANTGAGVDFTGAGVVVGWPISTIFTSAQFQNCSAPL
jgi:hypothetical protein